MCFYCAMSKKALALAKRYGRKMNVIEMVQEILDEQHKITAFSHPDCAIVTDDENIGIGKWGLIPKWTKTADDAAKMRKMCLNARSETVFSKPAFRGSVKQRCLIPVTGYFEFQHTASGVIPYHIFLRSPLNPPKGDLDDVFSLGGLYETWQHPDTKEWIMTFTVLTTDANALCRTIHNGGKNPFRMPVIIGRENEEKWLDKTLKEKDIERFFEPFENEQMDAYPVVRDFLKRSAKDRAVVDRVAPMWKDGMLW